MPAQDKGQSGWWVLQERPGKGATGNRYMSEDADTAQGGMPLRQRTENILSLRS